MTQLPFDMTLKNPYGYNFEATLKFYRAFCLYIQTYRAKDFFCRQTLGLN